MKCICFDAVAKTAGRKAAERSIHYAIEAEKIHEVMYTDAKKSVEKKKDIPEANVYVCPVCGHTIIGGAPDECPVCGCKKEKYIKFSFLIRRFKQPPFFERKDEISKKCFCFIFFRLITAASSFPVSVSDENDLVGIWLGKLKIQYD